MDTLRVPDLVIARQLYEEVGTAGKIEKLPLHFSADVLSHYREAGGYNIIRTDSSGRIGKPGGWSLDFGISGEGDSIIHIAAESYVHRLPESERSHWIEHMISLPVSANFLKGLIRPGCLDDGDIRKW